LSRTRGRNRKKLSGYWYVTAKNGLFGRKNRTEGGFSHGRGQSPREKPCASIRLLFHFQFSPDRCQKYHSDGSNDGENHCIGDISIHVVAGRENGAVNGQTACDHTQDSPWKVPCGGGFGDGVAGVLCSLQDGIPARTARADDHVSLAKHPDDLFW